MANTAHYAAAKHGVQGLAKVLATELAEYDIRVNVILPSAVNTPMVNNAMTFALFRPDIDSGSASADDISEELIKLNLLRTRWIEPEDVSESSPGWLADGARFVTGVQLPVDAGQLLK